MTAHRYWPAFLALDALLLLTSVALMVAAVWLLVRGEFVYALIGSSSSLLLSQVLKPVHRLAEPPSL